MNNMISSEARTAIAAGHQGHFRFRVVGQGEVPEIPVYGEQQWFLPVKSPPKGQDRIRVLERAGIPIKGYVISHEAPRLLTTPKNPDFKISPSQSIVTKKVLITSAAVVAGVVLLPVLAGLAVVVVMAVAAVVMPLVVVLALCLAPFYGLDPALIAVLGDGTWLELMTWYE